VKGLADIGAWGVSFHDDDLMTFGAPEAERRAQLDRFKKALDETGIVCSMATTNLFWHPLFKDGAFTSNDREVRRYAIAKSMRNLDVAAELGAPTYVFWGGREGVEAAASKEPQDALERYREALDFLAGYVKDKGYDIRFAIEPKPNEPMDHAYIPTIGHALAIAQLTRDPKRVGCLIESAHAILAGLDPADEIDFACAFGKLWSLHLNDQNGLKYDQDRPFGCTNLRSAFDQIRALERNGYGKRGEYVCFDVHPFRTTKEEHWLDHLTNSRRTFLRLLEKVRSFDEKSAQALVADRNYQALDQMVIEHLMGK
ncbi:MAG: xylose isomerase, partial [Verrucomicrobia bacterium]|nr:xylose isomerase [Verrucomicrobiota bacterium]